MIRTRHNNVMHAKPDLHVFLEWTINRSGSVITDVITLENFYEIRSRYPCFDSPNGQLNASATQQLGEGLVVTETRYRVRDKSTGKTVWRHNEKSHGSYDPPWGAGFGNLELIQWSADSAEVRFAIRCTDTVNVTDWIAARTDQSGGFATGVITKNGLRNVDRTQQQTNAPTQ